MSKRVVISHETKENVKLVYDSYNGAGGYINGDYLFQFDREMDFAKRKKMTYYLNYIKPIVDARVDPVFSSEPQVEGVDEGSLLDLFINNADNNGTSLAEMVHSATTETVLLSNSFLVMDNFPQSEIPSTLSEVLSTRKMPYIYRKSMLDVVSYVVDDWGKLEEIDFLYDRRKLKLDDTFETDIYNKVNSMSVTQYYKENDEIKIISKTDHGLGVVPVVFYNKDILSIPPYYSMSTLARQIYNTGSEINDLSRSQMFSILLLPSTMPSESNEEGIVISSKNALFFDADASNKPEFISPDSNIMKTSLELQEKQINTLIQTADVLGTTAIATGNKTTSGIAESYRFFGKQHALQQSSQIANYYYYETIQLFGKFLGQDYSDVKVSFPANFTPTFVENQQKIQALSNIAMMEISDEVTANVEADIVKITAEVMGWDNERLNSALESIAVESQVNE